jgi:hypothetical protein
MIATDDYGSVFFTVVFVQELLLLAYLLGGAALDASRHPEELVGSSTPKESSLSKDDTPDTPIFEDVDEETRFLFDVVTRHNEALRQNIDALDAGLIAVAVGIVAGTLFIGDKWHDLAPLWRFAALLLIAEAAISAAVGYVSTFLAVPGPGLPSTVGLASGTNMKRERSPRVRGAQDTVLLTRFVIDFSSSPVEATTSAIDGILEFTKANARVRTQKRTFTVVATCFVFAASVLAVFARVYGPSGIH